MADEFISEYKLEQCPQSHYIIISVIKQQVSPMVTQCFLSENKEQSNELRSIVYIDIL